MDLGGNSPPPEVAMSGVGAASAAVPVMSLSDLAGPACRTTRLDK